LPGAGINLILYTVHVLYKSVLAAMPITVFCFIVYNRKEINKKTTLQSMNSKIVFIKEINN
jgi:hypothetical protein